MCLIARENWATRNWRVRGMGRPWISRCPGDWITRESWATRKMSGRGRGGEQGEEALQKWGGAGRQGVWAGTALGKQGMPGRRGRGNGVAKMALPATVTQRCHLLDEADSWADPIPGRNPFPGGRLPWGRDTLETQLYLSDMSMHSACTCIHFCAYV